MGELFQRPLPAEEMLFTGERLTPQLTGETPIEHWHRYLLAREIARGRTVLDIASGEGYGSALLAQVAASVVGVDAADEAVAHAKRAYVAPNLRFEIGDARRIPLPDGSIDLVVSFETLEHFVEHDAFLQEVRRVLRPGGALLLSTPERDTYSPAALPPNPYHAKELTEAEFHTLLRTRFDHVSLQGQRVMLGSVLAGAQSFDGPLLCFERRGAGHFESSAGIARLRYVVALASDSTEWRLPPSIFIDTGRIGYTDGPQLEALNEELPALRSAKNEVVSLRQDCEELRRTVSQQQVELAEKTREIDRLSKALESGTTDLQTALGEVASLRQDCNELRRTGAQQIAELKSALAAQTSRADVLEGAAERAERAALVAREQMAHVKSHAEMELTALRASTSWRITAPLRAFRRLASRR